MFFQNHIKSSLPCYALHRGAWYQERGEGEKENENGKKKEKRWGEKGDVWRKERDIERHGERERERERRREEKKFKLSELALADSVRRFLWDKSGPMEGGSERTKVHGGGLRKMNWYSAGSGDAITFRLSHRLNSRLSIVLNLNWL